MSTRNQAEPHWLIGLLKEPLAQIILLFYCLTLSIIFYDKAKDAESIRAQVDTWIANAEAQTTPLAIQLVDEEKRRCTDSLALMRHRGFVVDLGDNEPATLVKIVLACEAGGKIDVTFRKAQP